jgi:hypothetical protein
MSKNRCVLWAFAGVVWLAVLGYGQCLIRCDKIKAFVNSDIPDRGFNLQYECYLDINSTESAGGLWSTGTVQNMIHPSAASGICPPKAQPFFYGKAHECELDANGSWTPFSCAKECGAME